jgi:SAM-dependent methyltransferase
MNVEFTVPDYVKTIKRNNIGYDFGGWSEGILTNDLYKNYNYFIFANSSVLGPFLPENYYDKWTKIFIDGLNKNNVKLFGCTINTIEKPLTMSHVQSYVFSVDITTLEYLIQCQIFSTTNYAKSFNEAIYQKEVLMSRKIINNGYNIGCLHKYYDSVDFTFRTKSPQEYNIKFLDDIMYPQYVNTLWTPEEIIFVKGNRINVKLYALNKLLKKITHSMKGVEIGGPSNTGRFIYENAENMDNVIFSSNTVWSQHTNKYNYYKNKCGNVIINDAVNISNVSNDAYDFVFASHCLEHIANPLKALNEWLRIIKNNSYVILILPEKSKCFDHKRKISSFSTILSQYDKNVNEDDLSTLPEILENHDLSMDPPAGNLEQFTKRSLANYDNRCLHHYVYSPSLLKEICNYLKCEFIFTITDEIDIWFIMRKI